jgi:hypothetical protein
MFWAYLTTMGFFRAAVAILTGIMCPLSARVLTAEILIFELLVWIPNLSPDQGITSIGRQRDPHRSGRRQLGRLRLHQPTRPTCDFVDSGTCKDSGKGFLGSFAPVTDVGRCPPPGAKILFLTHKGAPFARLEMRTVSTYHRSGRLFILHAMGYFTSRSVRAHIGEADNWAREHL